MSMALGYSDPARAQTPSPLAEWQYSAGIPLLRLFEGSATGWKIILGPAATYRPLYGGRAWRLPTILAAGRQMIGAT